MPRKWWRCRVKTRRQFGVRKSSALLCLAALILLAGCRNDMHTDPKFRPLDKSDFYPDGRASRSLVAGTIPRGFLRADSYLYTGMTAPNKPGDEMPFPVTREVLERGRERFNIYCTPCHSRLGDGNGVVVQRGYRRPPSFYDDKRLQMPLGHIFDAISNGFGAMPDYAVQVPVKDRWAIAAYIRALQLSQHATPADVPPGQAIPAAQPAAGGAKP